MKVRILKGLWMSFEEVRNLKDLTQRGFKVESLEAKGTEQDEEKIG